MNDKLAYSLTIASTAAAALALATASLGSANAYADDITIDNTPFSSMKSRAEVQGELMRRPQLMRSEREQAMRYAPSPQRGSTYTRQQARSDYVAAQDEVSALTGEDSGSAYLAARSASNANGRAIMGAPAR